VLLEGGNHIGVTPKAGSGPVVCSYTTRHTRTILLISVETTALPAQIPRKGAGSSRRSPAIPAR